MSESRTAGRGCALIVLLIAGLGIAADVLDDGLSLSGMGWMLIIMIALVVWWSTRRVAADLRREEQAEQEGRRPPSGDRPEAPGSRLPRSDAAVLPEEAKPAPRTRAMLLDSEQAATVEKHIIRLKHRPSPGTKAPDWQAGQRLELAPDPDNPRKLVFSTGDGSPVGSITGRHKLAGRLDAGKAMLHCEIRSIAPDSADAGAITVVVEAYIGDPGDVWQPPRMQLEEIKAYPVGLVGEMHRQEEIARCSPGEAVALLREPDNPHDSCAIVAVSSRGETIGYIARDHWLHDPVCERGRQAAAEILSLNRGPNGVVEVVLEVWLTEGSAEERAFGR